MRRLCVETPGGTMRGHIANMQVQPPSHRYNADLDHDSELHVGLVAIIIRAGMCSHGGLWV